MKYKIALLLLIIVSGSSAYPQNLPADKKATKETVNLYRNLKKSMQKGYLFGHQDDLAYGVNWKYEPGRSDVKDVVGDYPALYGWELGHIELDAKMNLDSVPFDKMRTYIQQGYERGGVITISWHGDNPLTGKTAWDNAPGTVASILPGGAKHAVYLAQLDRVAAFLGSLKGKKGEAIPVLYRPFHELTGGWFWWGSKTTTPQELKTIFRFTVDYLQNKKNLHNLVYVYNTGGDFTSEEQFLERYPGDDVIDMVSFDTYQGGNPLQDERFVKDMHTHMSIIEKVAKDKGKIPALGEVGFSKVPYAEWWTKTLTKSLTGHKIAYVLLWRNAGYKYAEKTSEFYVPYKGQVSEKDFVNYYQQPETLFEKDAAALKLYKK